MRDSIVFIWVLALIFLGWSAYAVVKQWRKPIVYQDYKLERPIVVPSPKSTWTWV